MSGDIAMQSQILSNFTLRNVVIIIVINVVVVDIVRFQFLPLVRR